MLTEPPATPSADVSPAESVKAPPAPVLPPPTDILMAPPAPPVAAPEPIDTEPVDPELDVPELNFSRPEAPVAPAFAERIVSAPLVVSVPAPASTSRAPPVAAPEPIDTEPVEPELDVPELNFNRPEAPVAPAFAERIVKAPLVLSVPAPASISKAPPVTFAPTPDVTSSEPP